MQEMGIAGIAPGPKTSKANPEHKVYPYLLRDRVIERPEQVWSADVTFIPMPKGSMSSIGTADMCCLGNCQTHKIHCFAWRH
jgi:putative transposase